MTATASQSRTHQAARKYIEIGFRVFPLVPGTKKPYKGSHGLLDAIDDPAKMVDLFREDSDIGAAMGRNLFVLDVDQHGEDGHATLRELERKHGPLPATPTVKTPSGGEHYYLAGTAPTTVIGPGLEVRGEGAYAALPPSTAYGRRYAWDNHILEVPIAPAPGWLLELAEESRPASGPVSKGKLRELARGVAEGENGGRNVACTRLTGHLLACGADPHVVLSVMIGWDRLNRPPLGEKTIYRIVDSIAAREARK